MPKKEQTNTINTDPWKPAQPYLKDVMGSAQGLYRSGPSMVAPQNQTLLSGYQNTIDTANNFNPALTNSAQRQMQSTINGDYMNNNPYLDATFDRMKGKVVDGVNSQFSSAGRYGSGAHNGILGESLGNLATDVYGSNYRTERQNQLNAAQLAPQMDAQYQGMMFNNANAITDVGQNIQDYDNMAAMSPYEKLQFYSNIINGGGGMGSNQTQTTPGGSRVGGVLGGAGSGFALGNAIVPGIGGIIGGGLGAIGGLF